MRIINAKFLAVLLTIFGFTVAQSDDASDERIRLDVRAKVVTPKKYSSQNTTIITTLNQDDVKYVEYDPYRMSLLVTDKRLEEYSMELTIFDHVGIARDSLTLLASLENEGSFEFSFDAFSISGTVQIVEMIQPHVN